MDEWLFERRRSGEEDRGYNDRNFDVDDADPAVARLFQEAIERQVNEQQEVTRLVESVDSSIATVNARIDELSRRVDAGLGPTADRLAAAPALEEPLVHMRSFAPQLREPRPRSPRRA